MNPIYRWMARSANAESHSWRELSLRQRIITAFLLVGATVNLVVSVAFGVWGAALGSGAIIALLSWLYFFRSWWQSRGGFQISRAQWHALLLAGMVVWAAMAAIDRNPWVIHRLGAVAVFAYWLYVTIRERGWHPRPSEDDDPLPDDA
ncbi:MAG: hypothetical protein HOH95_09600 [Dehalococcoidia bacterium]|jgi:hypothetical protein|nr:hypothetical protein [Dehalococcoidia bacterium]